MHILMHGSSLYAYWLCMSDSKYTYQGNNTFTTSTVSRGNILVQSNLYNPTLHGRAKLCWITEVVRLSNCLHNSTLTIMSDYAVKLYNTTG